MATATVNGAEIAYDDTGGDGPAVILAHGFVLVDGGTHAANLTHPAEVNAAIEQFVRSLPA